MLKYNSTQKRAVLDGDQAVVKLEDTMRICHINHNLIDQVVSVVLYRGFYRADLSFEITDPRPIVVDIKDEPAHPEMREVEVEGTKQLVMVDVPERKLFTELISPKAGQKDRWVGDFRLKDIEQIIKDNNLIKELAFTEIVDQK